MADPLSVPDLCEKVSNEAWRHLLHGQSNEDKAQLLQILLDAAAMRHDYELTNGDLLLYNRA